MTGTEPVISYIKYTDYESTGWLSSEVAALMAPYPKLQRSATPMAAHFIGPCPQEQIGAIIPLTLNSRLPTRPGMSFVFFSEFANTKVLRRRII